MDFEIVQGHPVQKQLYAVLCLTALDGKPHSSGKVSVVNFVLTDDVLSQVLPDRERPGLSPFGGPHSFYFVAYSDVDHVAAGVSL